MNKKILNLLINASDAMPGGGELFLKTKNVTHHEMEGRTYDPAPGDYVLLSIRDTGLGMDKETMAHIFEPFYTTKGMANGTGLGLTSVYGTVKAHHGYIDVSSDKGSGTTFNIFLPAVEGVLEDETGHPQSMIRGHEHILMVDDEEIVLQTGTMMLERLGYTVSGARNGLDAVQLYVEKEQEIDMVILDMIMPKMSGVEVFEELQKINPNVSVLISSGYDMDGQGTDILSKGCKGFIKKPFTMNELSNTVRTILDER